MNKAILRTFLIALVLVLPAGSFSAGTVKYMNIMSIYSDDKGAAVRNPEGVACDDESRLIIADTANHRLLRYVLKDRTLTSGEEIAAPQLTYPVLVKVNSAGDIFVLDGKQRRIVHLDAGGKFVGYLEPSGLPSPSSYVIKSFDIDADDNIYVSDIFSGRMIVLGPDGAYRAHINFPGDYGFISDLAVDFKGNVLLVDSVRSRVYSAAKGAQGFSPLTEGMKEQMRFPTNITTDNRGRIYLTDRNGSRIIVIGQDGSFLGLISELGWKEGLLNYPAQLCINAQGEMFVADTNNSRVQVFQLIK
ncbi:MAG: NHL repeat-containing protein [Nitrospirota bacterium]